MAFLTYDINPTLQLLAQGKASPLQGLGQGMQNFASMISQGKQMQMAQQKFEIEKVTMQVQQDLANMQIEEGKRKKVLDAWQMQADSATGLLSIENEAERAAAYGNLEDKDPLKIAFGKNVPSKQELQSIRLRGIGAKTVYQTEQARKLAEEKSKKDKPPKLTPETSIIDLEQSASFLKGQSIGAHEETIGSEMSDDDKSKLSSVLADTANKMREEARQAGNVLSESEAKQLAWDKIKEAGVVEYGDWQWNNYQINQDKLTSFLSGDSTMSLPEGLTETGLNNVMSKYNLTREEAIEEYKKLKSGNQ